MVVLGIIPFCALNFVGTLHEIWLMTEWLEFTNKASVRISLLLGIGVQVLHICRQHLVEWKMEV